MSTLTFADTHNMVAFLAKLVESDGFHEIIDFLNANQIRYALTVNPTIYTSCIEQFWSTAKAKTVNGEHHIQALIDKKKVIITETSIRSDLHLEDAGEETQQDDSVPTPYNDPPLSGEDSMQLSELMLLCTNFQKQVLDLEKSKDAQSNKIADLKKRVQRLERKKKSRTTGLKRLKKVDASKQGRSIKDIDKDADVSLVNDTQGRSDNKEMFDTNDLHGDEVNVDIPVGENQEQSAKEREVNTSVKDNDAPTTIEEITLAQTLI
ncbi:hypothetical protein Tco_1072220 [Tanacetum coccineum]